MSVRARILAAMLLGLLALGAASAFVPAPAQAQGSAAEAAVAPGGNAELPRTGPPVDKPRTRDLVIFWSFGAVVILGALAVITRTNPVVAVMCLVGTFVAIAAIYIMLLAHFLAIIQVLVYAGAIMVLFVFVVLILNREEEGAWEFKGWIGKALGAVAAVYLTLKFILVLGPSTRALELSDTWTRAEATEFGTTRAIGKVLFTKYVFPFEAVSLLLLIAVIGALVLSRPHDIPANPEPTAQPGTHGEGKELLEVQGRMIPDEHMKGDSTIRAGQPADASKGSPS